MREHEWTRVLGWPGYKVYGMEIDEHGKNLKLWVRRKKARRMAVTNVDFIAVQGVQKAA